MFEKDKRGLRRSGYFVFISERGEDCGVSVGREGIREPGAVYGPWRPRPASPPVSSHGGVPVCPAPLHPLSEHLRLLSCPLFSSRASLAGIWVLLLSCFCPEPQGEGRSCGPGFACSLACPLQPRAALIVLWFPSGIPAEFRFSIFKYKTQAAPPLPGHRCVWLVVSLAPSELDSAWGCCVSNFLSHKLDMTMTFAF